VEAVVGLQMRLVQRVAQAVVLAALAQLRLLAALEIHQLQPPLKVIMAGQTLFKVV
jgi:hypothetical protein